MGKRLQLNPEEAAKVREIAAVLKKGKSFLLTTHRNIDGDAIGSELALYAMLKKNGKEVTIINHDAIPAVYSFLPSVEKAMVSNGAVKTEMKPDVSVVIDCGTADRTGKVFEIVKKSGVIINVDHHFSNPGFGDINWINHRFSAAGEMIYFILSEGGRIVTAKEAECLYTALITDTGSFVHNIGPYTMDIAGELAAAGAAPEKIAKKIYFERPLKSVKLLSLCLSGLKFERRNKICWIKVDKSMYRRTGTKEEDTEGFIDILVRIKEADVVFFLKESGKTIKASLRSKERFDVEKIAAVFGGGGHKKAAGCYFEGSTLEQAERKILAAIRRNKK